MLPERKIARTQGDTRANFPKPNLLSARGGPAGYPKSAIATFVITTKSTLKAFSAY
jgi:hypothetical protein